MNTLSGGTFIRHKATLETVFQLDAPVVLSNPREDDEGNMYVCSQAGEILKFTDEGDVSSYQILGGVPSCIAFGASENSKDNYFTDVGNKIVFEKKAQGELNNIARLYEGEPLKGPTSIIYNKKGNYLIFSDSGFLGTTTLNRPKGSVFLYDLFTGITKPLLLNCLAYPSDIVYDDAIDVLYVTETYNNRILRLVQNPIGVFHCSVFHVFNGGVGPTSLALDELGNLYVGRYEFQDKDFTINGSIAILNREGVLIGELILPHRSEITGMMIPKNRKKVNELYLTESNFNGVLKIKLSQLNADAEKNHDNSNMN